MNTRTIAKTFISDSYGRLSYEINRWLEENPRIEILAQSQSSFADTSGDWPMTYTIVTITARVLDTDILENLYELDTLPTVEALNKALHTIFVQHEFLTNIIDIANNTGPDALKDVLASYLSKIEKYIKKEG